MTYDIRIKQREPDESGEVKTITGIVNEQQFQAILEIMKNGTD